MAGAVEVAVAVQPDGLLAGAGGEDPGDRPVDDAVALLVVVGPVVGVGPAELRLASDDPVAVGEGEGRPRRPAQLAVREVEAQDDLDPLVRREVAQGDLGPAAALVDRVGAERLDPDALGGADLEGDAAGDDLERLADLARDVVADRGSAWR